MTFDDSEKDNNPFFSIILSIYNIKEYLERCVVSLEKQSFKNFEVIFVDDGATDGSSSLCDQYVYRFKKATVIHKANGGLSSARNAGLRVANGKYIFFFDPDDWIDDSLLETVYNIATDYSVDVVKYGYRKIKNGIDIGTRVPCFDEGYYSEEQIRNNILPQAICIKRLFDYSSIAIMSAWGSIYKTEFLLDNGILFESEREILNEDLLFNLMVMIKAHSVYVIKKELYNYDYRENSLSKKYLQNMLERKEKLFSRFKSYLYNAGLFDQFEKEFYGFCVDGYYAVITNECGKYAEVHYNEVVSKVKKILNSNNCIISMQKCNSQNLTFKGRIIFYLMRTRSARILIWLYLITKNK